ncbi:arylamine N-acetyltransferase family protein [Phenylobacterium soli]|uniref:Arylamine N-acetyltransferase n=1 Tax=Phenylobacterium soli TaxID=2170551 RepID=A0A328ANA5_9CAUL|nr:arylamine N-acetyltransferase [Phenylobacterium soli]RAK55851.1 arylamine N-acetyltransferase [Phenylobacterium soli]
MDVQAYFDRIGFAGEARADLATLKALHRAHLLAIPYENLDVQLGRPVTTAPEAAFDKIVSRHRGGWCYEMNGLFGAVLDAIGFSVTRLAGGVGRQMAGDEKVGNHLVLLVDLGASEEGLWIADVGFGDGAIEPFALQRGPFSQDGHAFHLEQLDGRWWRFHNHPLGGAPNFDFTLDPADPALLAEKCHWLQTSPESGFVQTAVAQRWREDELLQLRGRSLTRIRDGEKRNELIPDADAYLEVLAREFGLHLPEAATLWPRILVRHEELFGQPA